MSTFTSHKEPHVTHIPTLTGGIGAAELERFYSQFFMPNNPPSMHLTLISRTIGADRVVDEMHVRFKHTQEVPWILPGVPATNKWVEVLVVSIVTVRGGKLYHEHVYWDQASVLVQTGLLDRNLVPETAKKLGVETLPIVGRRAARRVLFGWDGEEGEADNALNPDWDDDNDKVDAIRSGEKNHSEVQGKPDEDNTEAKKMHTKPGEQPANHKNT